MNAMKKAHLSSSFILKFPLCFPTMTSEDVLTIRTWYIKEGDSIQADPDVNPNTDPEKGLLEVIAPYGEIWISIPPFLTKPHRVTRILILENETIMLGTPFIELEPVENEIS